MEHVLTVDVEDWYHVENLAPAVPRERWASAEPRLEANVDGLLELFSGRGARATFFCLGRALERHPSVARRIVEAGHELACHGWSHELVYRQTPQAFREETRRAKRFLEELTGRPVLGYRASTFSITRRSLWALEVLADEGFTYDSSIAPLRHDRYGMPGEPERPHRRALEDGRSLLEFPVSVIRVLGWRFPLGGGFFRMFPLRWTERALLGYEHRGLPGMLYLHPWEIDPSQPRVGGLSPLRRLRHYARLSSTRSKLDRLLQRFRFTTMADALAACVS